MKLFKYLAALLLIFSTNVCLTSCGDDDEPTPAVDPKDYPQHEFFCVGGIGYKSISGADVEVTKLNRLTTPDEYTGDIVIPSSVTYQGYTYNVVSIGTGAFEKCTHLKSVTIPESVTRIGNNAFMESSLKSIYIGGNVKEIGVEAFLDCPELTSATITGKVEIIGKRAFARTVLQTVTLGDNIKEIGYEAFYKCDRLTSITIPDKIEHIGDFAFNECSKLAIVIIGKNIRTIGYSCFAYCNSLQYVTCKAIILPVTPSSAFSSSTVKKTLIVPGIALDYYKTRVPWSSFDYFQPILE